MTDHLKKTLNIIVFLLVSISCRRDNELSPEEQELEIIADNLQFAEGPAYLGGELYFTDIQANKIYKWIEAGQLQVFKENSGGANGLCFDNINNLIVCEGGNKRVVSISPGLNTVTLTDRFADFPYNEPNDVWVSPVGNIYFTDPVFSGLLSQDGEHVYCLLKSSGEVIRVTDDLVRPNGITGDKAGSLLYVSDYGASRIYKYSIQPDGTIADKELFADIKADGLDSDSEGNIYAAGNGIMIFNSSGRLINTIKIPGTSTNSCIVEEGIKTIFITTHTTVYKHIIN